MIKPVLWFCGALCWSLVYADESSFKNVLDCICSLDKLEVKKKTKKDSSYISHLERIYPLLCLLKTLLLHRGLQGLLHTQQRGCPSDIWNTHEVISWWCPSSSSIVKGFYINSQETSQAGFSYPHINVSFVMSWGVHLASGRVSISPTSLHVLLTLGCLRCLCMSKYIKL